MSADPTCQVIRGIHVTEDQKDLLEEKFAEKAEKWMWATDYEYSDWIFGYPL